MLGDGKERRAQLGWNAASEELLPRGVEGGARFCGVAVRAECLGDDQADERFELFERSQLVEDALCFACVRLGVRGTASTQ